MKYMLFSLLVLFTQISFAQSPTPPPPPRDRAGGSSTPAYDNSVPVVENKIFRVVEQMPEYPGGEEAMMKFIQKHIQYPKMERENDIQGRVVVGFIINEDGSMSDIEVKKSVSAGLDKEALRVVSMLGKFVPGKQQGKAVRVQFVLPIMFRLTSPEPPKEKKQ